MTNNTHACFYHSLIIINLVTKLILSVLLSVLDFSGAAIGTRINVPESVLAPKSQVFSSQISEQLKNLLQMDISVIIVLNSSRSRQKYQR